MNIDLNNINLDAFDFDAIEKASGTNPFEQDKKSSYVDERFYVLSKDKESKGQAIIAFMPDAKYHTLQQMFKINTTIVKNTTDPLTKEVKTQKRFRSQWSPKSINLPDPFHETYVGIWDRDPDTARKYKPQKRYIANIKIIKDPAKPENEGKIFLYEFSQTMANKLLEALCPSESDMQMGVTRKEIFNPMKGWVFMLKCRKGENGIVTYDSSTFTNLGEGKCIYGSTSDMDSVKKQLVEDLNKAYDLDEFKDPKNYKTYAELQNDLYYVSFGDFGVPSNPQTSTTVNIENTQPAQTQPQAEVTAAAVTPSAPATAPAAQPAGNSISSGLDDLLNSL